MVVDRERVDAARAALVDVLAAEYRLRRQAVREEAEATRWSERAEYAVTRDLAELADGARARALRHQRSAGALMASAGELQEEAKLLRELAGGRRWDGRAPPPASDLEGRFAAFEIDLELERMRVARGADREPGG